MSSDHPLDALVGTVALLRRFPLRSAAGDLPQRALVGPCGLVGDRQFVLTRRRDGSTITARDVPALAGVGARFADGALVMDTPLEDLARAAGEDVEVHQVASERAGTTPARTPRSSASHSGGAAVHLVSHGAASAPGAPAGCDPGERANLVLRLDDAGEGTGPGAERTWVGRVLRIGSLELALTRTPSRCLGVYAEVLRSGEVGVGDRVELGGWARRPPR